MTLRPLPCLALLSLVAGCVPAPREQPAPAPASGAPRARPAPPPAPAPAPAEPADWSGAPRTLGQWVYRRDDRGSIALFGAAGADALLTLRCDATARRIYLSRATRDAAPRTLTLRASSGRADVPARPTGGAGHIAADIAPTAPILDQIAFSRGQFAVESAGDARIIAPAHPEFARVVEDCRG